MNETSKCYQLRKDRHDFKHFLKGSGIDIGYGSDLLAIDDGNVVGWDMEQGDAQFMAGIPDHKYDFVYSSHCLEHMVDVSETLENWSRIVKSNGYLYIVVPDYVYYEKMQWPSQYNSDHKHSFAQTITRQQVNRSNHWHVGIDLANLFDKLGIRMLRTTLEIDGFDFNQGPLDQTRGNALSQICILARNCF